MHFLMTSVKLLMSGCQQLAAIAPAAQQYDLVVAFASWAAA
jgi:hypothetical protein